MMRSVKANTMHGEIREIPMGVEGLNYVQSRQVSWKKNQQ